MARDFARLRSTAVLLALLGLLISHSVFAANPSYRYTRADGTVLFTDIRMVPGDLRGSNASTLGSRSSYRGNYRKVFATRSCTGASDQLLGTRFASISDVIEQAASKYKLDPMLLKAIARVESCYDPVAVSRAGARGIMQLMPATAKSLSVSNSFDPVQNIDAGARYFASLLARFDRNTDLALAAYNAGPGAVEKYSGIPPYPETKKYVPTVLDHYRQFRSGSSRSW